jgi:uncharacterized membrane protein YedE/YeeE
MAFPGFTPLSGFGGGMLIGLAAVLLVWLIGRISGVSGIVAGALSPTGEDNGWRWMFLAGLIAAGFGWQMLVEPLTVEISSGAPGIIAAGLLVGIGTRLGGGCTSGHGVCGIARFSPRSLTAVAVFMATALLTATDTGLIGAVP